jgi:hypothetical protein
MDIKHSLHKPFASQAILPETNGERRAVAILELARKKSADFPNFYLIKQLAITQGFYAHKSRQRPDFLAKELRPSS